MMFTEREREENYLQMKEKQVLFMLFICLINNFLLKKIQFSNWDDS